MPSHPERVRRNYHTTVLKTHDNRHTMEFVVNICITRHQLASWMNRREMRDNILRLVAKAVDGA